MGRVRWISKDSSSSCWNPLPVPLWLEPKDARSPFRCPHTAVSQRQSSCLLSPAREAWAPSSSPVRPPWGGCTPELCSVCVCAGARVVEGRGPFCLVLPLSALVTPSPLFSLPGLWAWRLPTRSPDRVCSGKAGLRHPLPALRGGGCWQSQGLVPAPHISALWSILWLHCVPWLLCPTWTTVLCPSLRTALLGWAGRQLPRSRVEG